MTRTRQLQLRAALTPRKPQPKSTVRFLPPQPRGHALVQALRETAIAFRIFANKTDGEHRDRLIGLAQKREAKADAEEARLNALQPAGPLFKQAQPRGS